MRRDIWETRAKAEPYLRKAFRSWDPRVINKMVESMTSHQLGTVFFFSKL